LIERKIVMTPNEFCKYVLTWSHPNTNTM